MTKKREGHQETRRTGSHREGSSANKGKMLLGGKRRHGQAPLDISKGTYGFLKKKPKGGRTMRSLRS